MFQILAWHWMHVQSILKQFLTLIDTSMIFFLPHMRGRIVTKLVSENKGSWSFERIIWPKTKDRIGSFFWKLFQGSESRSLADSSPRLWLFDVMLWLHWLCTVCLWFTCLLTPGTGLVFEVTPKKKSKSSAQVAQVSEEIRLAYPRTLSWTSTAQLVGRHGDGYKLVQKYIVRGNDVDRVCSNHPL